MEELYLPINEFKHYLRSLQFNKTKLRVQQDSSEWLENVHIIGLTSPSSQAYGFKGIVLWASGTQPVIIRDINTIRRIEFKDPYTLTNVALSIQDYAKSENETFPREEEIMRSTLFRTIDLIGAKHGREL
jgi:hypothetical protein